MSLPDFTIALFSLIIDMKTETHLFVLLSKTYSSVSREILHITIQDTLSELDLKLLVKGITLTSEDYFQWAHRGAQWKLNNIVKQSKRFTPLKEAEEVADDFDIVQAMETEEVIDEALKSLTDKERAVMLMQSSLNISYSRMSKICGVTTHAIKALLTSAKRKMRSVGNPPPSNNHTSIKENKDRKK